MDVVEEANGFHAENGHSKPRGAHPSALPHWRVYALPWSQHTATLCQLGIYLRILYFCIKQGCNAEM